MRELFDLITENKIRLVACQDEDRLFRDITQIQVNIFVEACRVARVLLLTPTMLYDFAHPLLGVHHARQFRFKCEMAAEYINTFVLGKLHRAKRYLVSQGLWVGTRVPPGYMVDMRQTLPNGSSNPKYRRFVPFEPYAQVVQQYFEIFVAKGGCLHATVREIQTRGPFYPDPMQNLPPPGFRVVYPIHRWRNGFCPGKTGLVRMFTNAVYIGHYLYADRVIRYQNHEPIIQEDTFWKAFNYLSSVTLEGEKNPSYKPFRENARPTLEAHRNKERPLLSGLLFSQWEGKWRSVGTTWTSLKKRYEYQFVAPIQYSYSVWERSAEYIDRAVTTFILEKLEATFDADVWASSLDAFTDSYAQEKRRIKAQIEALERVMKNQIANLDMLSNADMIRDLQTRYEEAQGEHRQLSTDLAAVERESVRYETLQALRDSFEPALRDWESLPRETKRIVLQTFVDQIEASPTSARSIRLVVRWLDGTSDELNLASQSVSSLDWLPEDTDKLLAYIDRGASQLDIAQAFPRRTWDQIRRKGAKLRGTGVLRFADTDKPIRDSETYESYRERLEKPLPTNAGDGDHWTPTDVKYLSYLLDNGATQIEIAQAFPTRRWWRIRWKITQLRGSNIKISGVGAIKRNETFTDYCDRTGHIKAKNQDSVTVRDSTNFLDYPGESRARAR
jgi:hypothetical protein